MRTTSRRAVLDAALELVAEGGLDAVTISALTARSGVSNGSVYHHFGSRSGLFAVLYRESFEHCVTTLLPALEHDEPERAVRELVARYLGWVAGDTGRARFLYAAPLTAGPAVKASVFQPVAAWFAARAEEGALRPYPAWALDPVVMGPAHECARRHLAYGFDLGACAEPVADAVWGAVAPVG
ncbi:TetR/AcrR family transcriptional regulator [Saccharothrix longispora]|uniref:AcrR family transcriptional regulator n=1 Tax=Saccharothrix longispora TaxID=33920 RepID=A0ABU1PXZ2_9PSEU|nr:TetR/AcrR family transcriptional regulator [Saccharothrix longispora]MDR6595512.1 AcrR family transcriptional regulator [Saccharothrix longispora]